MATFEEAFDNVRRDINARLQSTNFAVNNYAKRAEQHMKSHRPWSDRTGEARRRLTASATSRWVGGPGERELHVEFRLAHGVPYGRHLEYGMGGRYAILRPTAELFSERMYRRLQTIWRGTGTGVMVGTPFDAGAID